MIVVLLILAALVVFGLGWFTGIEHAKHVMREAMRPTGQVLDFTPRRQDPRRPW